MNGFARHRDYYAGALTALIGAFAVWQGRQYGMGTLTDMGSGWFPVVLGAGMVLLGGLMAATARPAPHAPERVSWRGAAAIALAAVLFILLADRAGLLPATFACVFTAAMGSRGTKAWEAALLAAGVAVFGVVLFAWGLKVPFPVLRGVLS